MTPTLTECAIVDANVLIALLDSRHIHHERTIEALAGFPKLAANPINLAEVLIGYPVDQQQAVAGSLIERGIVPVAPAPEVAPELYARTATSLGLALPDAIAVATLIDLGGCLLTFDKRLAKNAKRSGLDVRVP